MTRTLFSPSKLVLGVAVTVSALAVVSCCKSKSGDESATPVASESAAASATAAPEVDAAVANSTDPEWKQKCPQADRYEGGTVTAAKVLQVYKAPDVTSEKLTQINSGTWVNLLGAKGTWLCIDYPCQVGQLCPGWVEERTAVRKPPVLDAGVDAAITDAAADASKDAGKDAAAADAGKNPLIIPPIKADAGTSTGKTPPGGRPPVPPKPPK